MGPQHEELRLADKTVLTDEVIRARVAAAGEGLRRPGTAMAADRIEGLAATGEPVHRPLG